MSDLLKIPVDMGEAAKQIKEVYKESKPEQQNKMLAYGAIAVCFVTACISVYNIHSKDYK